MAPSGNSLMDALYKKQEGEQQAPNSIADLLQNNRRADTVAQTAVPDNNSGG